MGLDLVRHLVAFEDVCEGVHVEAQRIGEADEHEHLGLHVAVAGDSAHSVQDLGQGIELKVAAGRWRKRRGFRARSLCRRFRQGSPGLPFSVVRTRTMERIEHELLHAHARLRKARTLDAPVALLHILAQGELDERRGAFDVHCVRAPSPA